MVRGFEDVWRPPVRQRIVRTRAILAAGSSISPIRDRLARIARRTPEVMVKVTGRTRDAAHLRAHLDYIARNGQLEAEGRDGVALVGRDEVRDVGDVWAWSALADRRRRANAPLGLSLILSMPAGTDAIRLRDAARAFAQDAFADRHDYLLVLHTDTPHPHVHVTVCARGDQGQRLNPKKADLEAWRQMFAQALRDRGVEAEATPRRARGVTLKAERGAVRQMRERHAAGGGGASRVAKGALTEAVRLAASGRVELTAWEQRLVSRQAAVRALYRAQVDLLAASPDARDRELAQALRAFVGRMPAPVSRRLALARELRAKAQRPPAPSRGRER